MTRIPLLVPSMPDADGLLPYLRRIDANRQYTNFGPLSSELERRIADHLETQGAPLHVTTVANATVGIELALQAMHLAPGARVLLPAITFVATATAVLRAGLVPVIGDVDPATWCLTPAVAGAAMQTGRIDAVLPVATFGCAQDVNAWDAFATQHECPVLIDAAGAFGNQQVGAMTDVVFSFHATKAFGAGEGGAVASSSAERIAMMRRLSNFGIDTSIGQLRDIGTNGKMSEYHCAVGLASFDVWERTRVLRTSLYSRYSKRLRERCPQLVLQQKPLEGVYPLMAVLVPERDSAGRIAAVLDAAGIDTRRWYCPALHRHPALRDQPTAGPLQVGDTLGERILGLPFYIGITDPQIDRICEHLAQALSPSGTDA